MSLLHQFNVRSSALFLNTLLIVLLLSGCGLPSATDRGVAVLDAAIGDLLDANADWQQILNDVLKDLPDELQSTVGFEVSTTLVRAIRASGSEVKCVVDFLHDRVREDLIRIKAYLLNEAIPPLMPVFCDVESVDMAMVNDGRQNKLLIFGYNFDIKNPVQIALLEGTQEVNVNEHLFVKTHYEMVLDLGRTGVPLSLDSQFFILRWQDEEMSRTPIIQPLLPPCEIKMFRFVPPNNIVFIPPHTEGDKDFNDNGPEVTVQVQLWPSSQTLEQWDLEIFMEARETDEDWTTATGYKDIQNFFVIDKGYVLDQVIPLRSIGQYTDNDHEDDLVNPMSPGPVDHFVVIGDTSGDEAGIDTKVTIHFNPIEFKIRQIDNCR